MVVAVGVRRAVHRGALRAFAAAPAVGAPAHRAAGLAELHGSAWWSSCGTGRTCCSSTSATIATDWSLPGGLLERVREPAGPGWPASWPRMPAPAAWRSPEEPGPHDGDCPTSGVVDLVFEVRIDERPAVRTDQVEVTATAWRPIDAAVEDPTTAAVLAAVLRPPASASSEPSWPELDCGPGAAVVVVGVVRGRHPSDRVVPGAAVVVRVGSVDSVASVVSVGSAVSVVTALVRGAVVAVAVAARVVPLGVVSLGRASSVGWSVGSVSRIVGWAAASGTSSRRTGPRRCCRRSGRRPGPGRRGRRRRWRSTALGAGPQGLPVRGDRGRSRASADQDQRGAEGEAGQQAGLGGARHAGLSRLRIGVSFVGGWGARTRSAGPP